MELKEWLDDVCVRFIINLPAEESQNPERLCFQIEEAQWFYEDFIRPLDPHLPSLTLRAFSLRIFQHCPTFHGWTADHYNVAFTQFMEYKKRVPVRGAIMLNHAMDKVVLVRGWKKGASWSFPRGKINKDEPDLDCAVREVYEETGYDIAAAGLVKTEREMKSIDVTMREQNMKLYVFRDVPEDTHFEAQTRKEIGAIEWYRLTDLPTVKKHKQHNSTGDDKGTNHNKFYMVAPFLNPLRKWIQQQKKSDKRYSSGLAAPPIMADESELETTHDPPALLLQQPQVPSDLPEVTVSKPLSPNSQMRKLFNLDPMEPVLIQTQPPAQIPQPAHLPQTDTAKSNALLSLLRHPPTAELRSIPRTPLEQTSFPPNVAPSPQYSHVRPPQPISQPPPFFQMQPEVAALSFQQPQHAYNQRSQPAHYSNFPPNQPLNSQHSATTPLRAPYQQTGDPEFARSPLPGNSAPRIPAASDLPKLTSHTKSLLDIFSTKSPALPSPGLPKPAASNQSLLDLFKSPAPRFEQKETHSEPSHQQNKPSYAEISSPPPTGLPSNAVEPKASKLHSNALLKLFSPSSIAAPSITASEPVRVELAAEPAQRKQDEAVLDLFRKQKQNRTTWQQHPGSTAKEGKVSANMSGPLDQPNFDAISKSQRTDPNEMGRSPLTTHRTLFDPNQPTTMKIMPRPETPRTGPAKSPRPSKARPVAASPKRNGKQSQKEAPKPFQPQILKRPQSSDNAQNGAQHEMPMGLAAKVENERTAKGISMSREVSSERERATPERKASDSHKQSLLSLFGSGSSGNMANIKPVHTPSRVVSPLSMSQMTSPREEVPVSAIDGPMLTRSRMGSLVSAGTNVVPARPALEKRQTTAQDKAFLLGMLGKIASQPS